MSIPSVSISSLFEDDTTGGLVYKQELKNYFLGYVINIFHINIDEICELVIACQSKLLLKNLQKQVNDENKSNKYETSQGFLISEWSIDSLKKLLSPSTSLLLCITDNNNHKLAGYQLLTSPDNFIQYTDAKLGQLELDHNVITQEQWKELTTSSHDIHYLEETGVDPGYRCLGIGSSLINLAKIYSSKGIFTDVIFYPYNNVASANLKRKNEFLPIGIWNQISGEYASFKSKIFLWLPKISNI